MKKLLLASMCVATALTISACDKKQPATESATTTSGATALVLSHDNVADIKSDLESFSNLQKSQEAKVNEFQAKVTAAMQKGGKEAQEEGIKEFKKFFEEFSKSFDEIKLKSAEVDDLRNKYKDMQGQVVEMMEISTSGQPDANKMMELQKKITESTTAFQASFDEIQTKIDAAK
ncbi:hypothetical protein [Acinetobacter larvae]|uniref:Lipoprotein n=1 Tax=Acinetobacter larvae TaxID=1789224 RepID=A0A1B2M3C3_9GAMM|nr:hypothetical protein [Acinetobacter larvae]AOA59513.1 hypothetical protein BFG52_14935 [Acinetobacter larvae]